MNVVMMTTPHEDYHKYLCAEIAKRHNVVAVLHPSPPPPPKRLLHLSEHRKSIGKYGFLYHVLDRLANNKFKVFGWNLKRDVAEAEHRFFPEAEAQYDELVADKAHYVANINGPEGVELLRGLKPDVVINSGGPIYRAPLIEAAKLMLNYHTGIAPVYNGADSVFWTYVNGQPHLTGGTLMVMNKEVDGGDMLAHYLPSVDADDTPGAQFMKTIRGGVDLCSRFVDDLTAGKTYVGVPQSRPMRFTYSSEWTVYQNMMIARRVRQRICERFVRPEVVSEYWNLGDPVAAKRAAEGFLLKLVYDA